MNSVWKKIVSLVVLVVVILGVAYLIGHKKNNETNNQTNNQGDNSANQLPKGMTVDYTKLDQVAKAADKLPSGWPSNIPVETGNVKDSYVAHYDAPAATQYTISYYSDKTVTAKYNEYLNYMTTAGYDFGKAGKNATAHILYGTKNGSDLSVVVTLQGSQTFVQLTYLERK